MNAGTAQHYARSRSAVLYIVTIVAGGWGKSHGGFPKYAAHR